MKSKMNIKNIVVMAIIGIISLFFINMSLAANTAKVNVETANLRETASADSKILEQLSKGAEVEIIEQQGDWYKVKANGITGYLRNDLLEVPEEIKETNTVETNSTENVQEEQKVENNQSEENTQVNENEIKIEKYKIAEDTKLKIVPIINATDLIEVKTDEEVNVIETINDWVCVQKGTTKGWIRKEKLKSLEEEQQDVQTEQSTEEQVQEPVAETVIKTLYVNSETVNVRKEANTTSEVVTKIPVNTAVDVVKEENGWSKVKVSGKEGYILSSLLSTTKQEVTSRSSEVRKVTTQTEAIPAPAANANSGSVVAIAKSYIGSKYVYGGSSPSGFDCSGFTSYVYKQHGVSLSRTAAAQYNNGVGVSRENLQPGDLVMFGSSASNINHVGIYIGGGQIVHAANKSRGVTIDTINSGYYNNNYVGARRV